jgi:imidazolonepropionase-like amidohydrolase
VLVGAHEAYKKTALIKSFNVPVVLSRLHRLPDYTEQATDWPFRLPALLKDSGITVALSYTGDMEAMGTRNLAFTAGTAAAYGCSAEEALQMITLNPAKILGIDNYTGSIEVGKNADFFISEGDALDMRTCKIFRACITGKVLDLNNHQKELYLKYSKKYGLSNP